jgi:hypothetical protein
VFSGLIGCKTPKYMAVINVCSSPAYASLTFKVKQDNSLTLLKDVRGKESYHLFKMSNNSCEALLTAVNNAHAEIKDAVQRTNIGSGAYISITIGDDGASAATIEHYAQNVYKFKHVPILFEKLHEIVPERFWR